MAHTPLPEHIMREQPTGLARMLVDLGAEAARPGAPRIYPYKIGSDPAVWWYDGYDKETENMEKANNSPKNTIASLTEQGNNIIDEIRQTLYDYNDIIPLRSKLDRLSMVLGDINTESEKTS